MKLQQTTGAPKSKTIKIAVFTEQTPALLGCKVAALSPTQI